MQKITDVTNGNPHTTKLKWIQSMLFFRIHRKFRKCQKDLILLRKVYNMIINLCAQKEIM